MRLTLWQALACGLAIVVCLLGGIATGRFVRTGNEDYAAARSAALAQAEDVAFKSGRSRGVKAGFAKGRSVGGTRGEQAGRKAGEKVLVARAEAARQAAVVATYSPPSPGAAYSRPSPAPVPAPAPVPQGGGTKCTGFGC